MITVSTYLALSGPSYPTAIARSLGTRDGSTWKAVVKPEELGIVESVADRVEEGRRTYGLSRRGWYELEAVVRR
jgi:hypothetical protein